MEQHFASLSKRQTMLLLTAVTFGADQAAEAFDHLPDSEAELLKHRASEIMQIPRDKRISLLVQEIKRLVTSRRSRLWAADPERLASILRSERASMVEVVLRALPAHLAQAVREHLPNRKVVLVKEVRGEVLNIVRWKLEELLAKSGPRRGSFKFSDLLVLQSRELLTLCDRMGARALATALAGLPPEERESLLTKLPPDQRALANKAAVAGESRKLPEAEARTLLTQFGVFKAPGMAMRSAGAQRIARACLAQSAEFSARVVERHPGEFGRLLASWIREERARPVRGDGGRSDIVEQLERLAQKGVVDRPIRLTQPPKVGPGTVNTGSQLKPRPPSELSKLTLPKPPRAASPEEPSMSKSLSPARKPAPPRRDAIAEREARKAGAVSSRPPPPPTNKATTQPSGVRAAGSGRSRTNTNASKASRTSSKVGVRKGPGDGSKRD